MDNKKIGKLIADLRKAKGLTQQDLGDMVGIGFRAVSKWERGITMPDISIINELSKILGITSDELLSGEINKETKSIKTNKVSNKIKITISIITVIILFITSTILYYQNKTYVYEITQVDSKKNYIEGQVTFKKEKITIMINDINIYDQELLLTKIKDYEYEMYNNETYLFGYGKNPKAENEENINSVQEFINNFRINYDGNINKKRNEIINNNFLIRFNFIDEDNNLITKEIEFILY